MLDQHVENGMEVRVNAAKPRYEGHEGVVMQFKKNSFGRVWADVELISHPERPVVTLRASDLDPAPSG